MEMQQESIYVSVEDNGKGMNNAAAAKIHQAPTDSENGNGLALYNVNRRLSMMFGEHAALHVTSTIGSGTKIYFALPYEEVQKQWIS